jgi:hypothetical protein
MGHGALYSGGDSRPAAKSKTEIVVGVLRIDERRKKKTRRSKHKTSAKARSYKNAEAKRLAAKAAAKTVARTKPENEKPVSAKEALDTIKNLVWQSAEEIVRGIVDAAKKGQLAPAKYAFELGGIFPVTEETATTEPQELLVQTLLRKAEAQSVGANG